MEEHEYRKVYSSLKAPPCVFEKAILSGRWDCAQCRRVSLAEREVAACFSETARCAELLKQLRQNAKFALKISQVREPLPHSKEMKVQCGGLWGLQEVLSTQQVVNIEALVTQSLSTFGEFERLPYQEIVKFISRYEVIRRNHHV